MKLSVITNENFKPQPVRFTRGQFSRLSALHAQAVRATGTGDYDVSCRPEAGMMSFTFYPEAGARPSFQFHARQDAGRLRYEVFKQGQGKIAQSRSFDEAIEKLSAEIAALAA